MQEIIMQVNLEGEIKIETKGFKGKACLEATRELIKGLGGKVESDTPTKEMNENAGIQNRSRA